MDFQEKTWWSSSGEPGGLLGEVIVVFNEKTWWTSRRSVFIGGDTSGLLGEDQFVF